MKLAIGTVQFGLKYGLLKKKINLREIKKIKNFLLKSNIEVIDTAMNYGNSEKILGDNNLKKLKIITKIIIPVLKKKKIENWLSDEINHSLNNLKVNKIYGLLVHDHRDLLGKKGKNYLKLLMNLKKRNIVKKIGISIYDPKELDKTKNFFKPDIVQVPYNVLDQRIETSGWLEKLKKSNVEIYARSCFLQGLLLNYEKTKKINSKFIYHEKSLNKWFDWCKKNKITPLRACLSFLKLQKKINYLVIGFDNFDQLKMIVKNFNKKNLFIPNIFTSSNLNLIDPRKWYNR